MQGAGKGISSQGTTACPRVQGPGSRVQGPGSSQGTTACPAAEVLTTTCCTHDAAQAVVGVKGWWRGDV